MVSCQYKYLEEEDHSLDQNYTEEHKRNIKKLLKIFYQMYYFLCLIILLRNKNEDQKQLCGKMNCDSISVWTKGIIKWKRQDSTSLYGIYSISTFKYSLPRDLDHDIPK
uniref:Uncharacterized protein n=1 Tax=Rhizophagus irregularis (strain DAOM 181602 / DAOM 197198 / MUCL 43194) TaxID=747089 RepID=U9SQS4_RHIID